MMKRSCHLRARHGVQGQRMSESHFMMLVRSVVESASQRNLAGITIHSTETFSANHDVSVWKHAGLFLSVVAVKEYLCSVRIFVEPFVRPRPAELMDGVMQSAAVVDRHCVRPAVTRDRHSADRAPRSRQDKPAWNAMYMSEEEGTADCSHMFLAPVGLQSFLLLHRRTRGSHARAAPASDTIRGQRSPTHPNLATSRQPPQHCAGTTLASDTCRG